MPRERRGEPVMAPAPSASGGNPMLALMNTQASATLRVRAAANGPFLLRHFLTAWDVAPVTRDDKTEMYWLPHMAVHWLTGGVQGVHVLRTDQVHDPKLRYIESVDKAKREGWQYPPEHVPAEFTPEGVNAGPYCRPLDCVDPLDKRMGVVHKEVWDVPQPPIQGLPQEWDYDTASFNRWRLWLVESGKIAPPRKVYIRRKSALYPERVLRAMQMNLPKDLRDLRTAAEQKLADAFTNAKLPERAA